MPISFLILLLPQRLRAMLGEDEWECIIHHLDSDIYSICNLRAVSQTVRRVTLCHMKTVVIPKLIAYLSAMRYTVHASSPTIVLARFLQLGRSSRQKAVFTQYICATCRRPCDDIATCDCHIGNPCRRMQFFPWCKALRPPLIALSVAVIALRTCGRLRTFNKMPT